MADTIFIVDDDSNIVIALEYLMKRAGYEVVIASDGQEALEYLSANKPSLMILDVMMPHKNGFEVCEQVRSENRFSDMPILMLSAKGREAEMKKGLSLGADDYIAKPFSTHELIERVKSLLQAKK